MNTTIFKALTFFRLIKDYEKKIESVKAGIELSPSRWRDYQKSIDEIFDSIFALCLAFEKQNEQFPQKVQKMKSFFIEHFRSYFELGKYNRWVIERPYGYLGDFRIIDEIYLNEVKTNGVEGCLDDYFLRTGAAIATRNRKEDFKALLKEKIVLKIKNPVKVLDVAAGPCRDVQELFESLHNQAENVFFDCLDQDLNAIKYAKEMIASLKYRDNIRFIQKNVLKIALSKNVRTLFPDKYDIIFSTGLFDYLNPMLAALLIKNLKLLLKDEGVLLISNYRDKHSNPSRYFMEWGGGWDLIYRTEDEFLNLFLQAGFKRNELSLQFEPLRVMQYCIAKQ